ncbi:MAG: hypothetical protein ABSD20_04475 [Terriglobales bacterium]
MRVQAFLVLALLFAPAFKGQSQENPEVWVEKNEVWRETAAGPRQLTHDGTTKSLAALSPNQKRLVYLVGDWSSDGEPPKDVVVADGDGQALRHVVPDGYVPGEFDKLEWIDNQRIGAMTCGHANCMYWILDADSGKTLKVMQGGFDFVWSHNRRWVARRFEADIYAPDGSYEAEYDCVVLDEKHIYPPYQPGQNRQLEQGHTVGEFAWSPHDIWLGFTDTVTPEGDPYVVLVSPAGTVLRDTVPVDVQYDAIIVWDDDSHLRLLTGGRSFNFIVVGNEVHEIKIPEGK